MEEVKLDWAARARSGAGKLCPGEQSSQLPVFGELITYFYRCPLAISMMMGTLTVLFYCFQEVYVYNLPGGLKGLFLFHMKQILVCLVSIYIVSSRNKKWRRLQKKQFVTPLFHTIMNKYIGFVFFKLLVIWAVFHAFIVDSSYLWLWCV